MQTHCSKNKRNNHNKYISQNKGTCYEYHDCQYYT